MSDDRFLERLRDDAQQLRYDADDVALTRMRARIRARIVAPVTVSQLLANWMRPLTVALSAITLAATLGVAWYETHPAVTVESTVAASNIDVEMAGYSFGD
jgi:hypothetical protein